MRQKARPNIGRVDKIVAEPLAMRSELARDQRQSPTA